MKPNRQWTNATPQPPALRTATTLDGNSVRTAGQPKTIGAAVQPVWDQCPGHPVSVANAPHRPDLGKPYHPTGYSFGIQPLTENAGLRFQNGPYYNTKRPVRACKTACFASPLVQSFRTGKKLVRDAAAREKAKKEAAAK